MSGQIDLFGFRVTNPAAVPPSREPTRSETAFTDHPTFAFPDAVRSERPAAPPASERQASFAADIARGLGIPLPLGTDALEVGGFIERHRVEYAEEAKRRALRRRR